jgi:uncharacterized glyoxalase superfamily protein PhnB
MVANPPKNTPRISPYLLYEDLATAIDWLTNCFGFSETLRIHRPCCS